MSSRWSKVLPPTPKESPYTLPATVPEEPESPVGTPPAQHVQYQRPSSTPPPRIASPRRRISRPRPRRPVPRKPVQITEISSAEEEGDQPNTPSPSTPHGQASSRSRSSSSPPSPLSPSASAGHGSSAFGRQISSPRRRRPILRKPVAHAQTVPSEVSPTGRSGRSEHSYSPQSPYDAETAVTAAPPAPLAPAVTTATKKTPKGIVRFRLSALVVQGARRLSRGTTAALARSSSLVSTRSKSSYTSAAAAVRDETPKRRGPQRPIDVDVLHAGPGGIFEPDPEVNPFREAFRRPKARARHYNAAQESSNSSSTPPSSTREHHQRPRRHSTDPRLRQRQQQPDPVPTTTALPDPLPMADPAHFPPRSDPSSPSQQIESSSGHSHFKRNPIGMEVYMTEPPAPPPSTRPAPKTAVGRFLRAVWDLPWRSRTHVTVTYIPASAKPDGTASKLWFRSKKAENDVKSTPVIDPNKAVTYARGSRYLIQQELVQNLPVEIYSSTSPPVTIAPAGATRPNTSLPQA